MLEDARNQNVKLIVALSWCKPYQTVRVEIERCGRIFFKRLRDAKSILELCTSIHEYLGYHPNVHGIDVAYDYDGTQIVFRCH